MNLEYERNHSHYHCWEQYKYEFGTELNPACGQPIENHKQCCLCDTKFEAPAPTHYKVN